MSHISSMMTARQTFSQRRGPRRHKGPSALAEQVWRLTQQQQFPVSEVALLLALAPQRVARIVDAMCRRRVECWRMV